MKHQELVERYIYAVTRYMKKEERDDVAKELQSIVDDMLEERCGEAEPDEETVKAVLNELGDPRDLYGKYSSDGKECLIGAPYYGVYKSVMKTVLICVAVGLFAAQLIVCIIDASAMASVAEMANFIVNMIVEVCATVFDGLAFAFAAVTLGFAVMYHKGIKMDTLFDSLEQLPQLPKKETSVSKSNLAFCMGISIIFYTLFLLRPEVICTYDVNAGVFVPILNAAQVHGTWYLIIAYAGFGIWRECVKIIEGTYTKKLVNVTTIANIASAVLATIWLWNPQILNEQYVEMVKVAFVDELPIAYTALVHFNYFFLGCIWLALVIDWVVVFWKNRKCEK